MTNPKINRKCDECTMCCQGWLTANILGREMQEGSPCYYVTSKGCSIYNERPENPCATYKCEWLKDDGSVFPHWFRPDLSGVIINQRFWGKNKENAFWNIRECGKQIDSKILNWIYMYASKHNLCMRIQVANNWYTMGPPEFVAEVS